MPYEQAVRRLEEIVAALGNGTRPLTESLSPYEEGLRLIREADQALRTAEDSARDLLSGGTDRDSAAAVG